MAKKPPRNYTAAALDPTNEQHQAEIAPISDIAITARRGRPPSGTTLKEMSKPVQLYLHPVGLKAIKRFALEENTKVHTLLIEAIEMWAKSKGLNEPIRANRAPE
ncbi:MULTISPECIES: hypothetical protein [Acidiphilium]|uniref:hypothetical protein n=1 Tax=Acidiphilium TaxID=522 RepID=UPI00257E0A05|nr:MULTISPECIES: hypothetical protein [Acidiphilium]HQT84942.1 hypothetical protein [Acidiphilium rubrum]